MSEKNAVKGPLGGGIMICEQNNNLRPFQNYVEIMR